ncbi:MAG TPA: glycosyltransferase family 4 protein [Pyrinomonadaceae bacterium]|nr:glycosyltransferase family 4 protein [Pyrinomonadaceae bacterium]
MSRSRFPIKVVLIISDIDKAIGFEWITENIDRSKFDLTFILLNSKPSYLAQYLRRIKVPCHELIFRGRSDMPISLWRVVNILRKEKADVVHTHLFSANVIGHVAARILNIKKRIYTRHSTNENRIYYNKQWVDRVVNSLATDIIAISENVKNVLIQEENVSPGKISLIHHGFDLERFITVPAEEIAELRAKYNPTNRSPAIGVVARYSHWKGIQYIVPAFKRVLQQYPNALLLLANAKRGDFKDEIALLLSDLPEGSYHEIEFEHNLFALYHLFDVYVHTPIDPELEAFGQTYVEALAAGIPSVFTNSGVAPEFIKHEQNAIVVDFQNSEQIYHAVIRLLEDDKLCSRISQNGQYDVRQMFSLEKMVSRFEELYSK